MRSNNHSDPDSTVSKARTILTELARNEKTRLEIDDVSTIMNRIGKCSNGDELCNLLAGDVPDFKYGNTRSRYSLENHALFYSGGLEDGFEKSMEIVAAANITEPQSYSRWTRNDKKSLRAEMKKVDRWGNKARFEQPDTWANSGDNSPSDGPDRDSPSSQDDDSMEDNPQDLDRVNFRKPLSSYDKRQRDLKDDLL